MLEIITSSGISLDLPSDTQIDITIENPLFLADRIPTPYSLSIELPSTFKNLTVFGRPDLATSIDLKTSTDIELKFNGLVFFSGVITVEQTTKRTISVTIDGILIEGRYDKHLNEVDMKSYDFYMDDSTGGGSPGLEQFLNNAVKGNEFITIAPIRNSAVEWDALETMQSYSTEEYLSSGRNLYNMGNNTFTFTDSYNRITFSNLTPIVKISYLFKALLGEMVDKNPFIENQLNKLVIIPSYIRKMSYDAHSGLEHVPGTYTHTLFVNKALSSIRAGDILIDLLNLICASVMVVNGKFKLEYNKDILSRNDIADWQEKIEREYTLKNEDGISYSWGFDSTKKNTSNEEKLITLPNYKAISEYAYDDKVSLNFKIDETGEIFKRTCSSEEIKYSIVDSGLNQRTSDNSEYNAVCDFKAVECTLHRYATTHLDNKWKEFYIPEIEFSGDSSSEMYIGILHGFVPTGENEDSRYPLISSHNYDMVGNKLSDISLTNHYRGFLASYHSDFEKWLNRKKTVATTRVNLDELELKNLDIFRKVHCLGKDFFIRNITIHITNKEILPADVELIEA